MATLSSSLDFNSTISMLSLLGDPNGSSSRDTWPGPGLVESETVQEPVTFGSILFTEKNMKRLIWLAAVWLTVNTSVDAQQCSPTGCCSHSPIVYQSVPVMGATTCSPTIGTWSHSTPVSYSNTVVTGYRPTCPNGECAVSYPATYAMQQSISPVNVASTNLVDPMASTQTSYLVRGSNAHGASYGRSSGLAQQKAQQAAQTGLRGHVGGGLGGARFEGVGWSNASAQHAVQNCCYWGTRPVSQIGVSRGRDGFWYACVLYN